MPFTYRLLKIYNGYVGAGAAPDTAFLLPLARGTKSDREPLAQGFAVAFFDINFDIRLAHKLDFRFFNPVVANSNGRRERLPDHCFTSLSVSTPTVWRHGQQVAACLSII